MMDNTDSKHTSTDLIRHLEEHGDECTVWTLLGCGARLHVATPTDATHDEALKAGEYFVKHLPDLIIEGGSLMPDIGELDELAARAFNGEHDAGR